MSIPPPYPRRNTFDCLDLILVVMDWASIIMMDVLQSMGVSANQVTVSKMLRSARILKVSGNKPVGNFIRLMGDIGACITVGS